MSYSPGRSAAATYSPDEFVFTSRAMPVAVLLTVTVALEMDAPVLSRTVPVKVAVSCARDRVGKISIPTIRTLTCRLIFCISPPGERCSRIISRTILCSSASLIGLPPG